MESPAEAVEVTNYEVITGGAGVIAAKIVVVRVIVVVAVAIFVVETVV